MFIVVGQTAQQRLELRSRDYPLCTKRKVIGSEVLSICKSPSLQLTRKNVYLELIYRP